MPDKPSFSRLRLVRTEDMPPPPIAPSAFVELGVSSPFSFLRGASDAIELVQTALALGYDAIGVADPVSIYVDTFGTSKVPQEKLVQIVRDNFQMTPRGIIESLQLRRPIFKKTAAYGHFGRKAEGELFPWEKTDLGDELKSLIA